MEVVKDLINDQAVVETHKKYTQLDTRDIRYTMKENDEMIYFIQGLIVRVANTEIVE